MNLDEARSIANRLKASDHSPLGQFASQGVILTVRHRQMMFEELRDSIHESPSMIIPIHKLAGYITHLKPIDVEK